MSEQLPGMNTHLSCLRVAKTREAGIFQESGSSLRCLLSPGLWGKAETERDALLAEICSVYPRCLLGLAPPESRDVEQMGQFRARFNNDDGDHWYWIGSADLVTCREIGGALGKDVERLLGKGAWCAFFFPVDAEPPWTDAPVIEHEPSSLNTAMRTLNASAAIVPFHDDADWLIGLNPKRHEGYPDGR